MQPIIITTLYLLSVFIPLTFTLINSELFEFPKFIILLSGTLVITIAWIIDYFQSKKANLNLKSYILNPISISVLAVLLTQLLATIFSISPYTSIWGYYGRFHQGLITTICYTIIYFSAINWLDTKSTLKIIKISVGTSIFVSLFAIAEHFGIDKNLWIQDVQSRVFSTLGQPNWLAAYLIPNIFLSLYLSSRAKSRDPSTLVGMTSFVILFTALLFTKSRSGLIGFGVSFVAYWLLILRQFSFTKIKTPLLLYSTFCILFTAIIGTPWTPPVFSLLHSKFSVAPIPSATGGTALENGGTESGDIRKIVWTGALKLIQKYPLLGTGPETFAYTYYWVRPLAHNQTSEWDFLYNKAHNEYLNIAAGSGLIGLLAYLYFHWTVFKTSFTKIEKSKKVNQDQQDSLRHLYPVLGASIVAFFITNFFGFSVIPVYFLLIIIAVLPATINNAPVGARPASPVYLLIFIVLIYPIRLFMADYYYARGKAAKSLPHLQKAVAMRPGLDLYHADLGETYALLGQKDQALKELEINKKLNPYHLNFYKSRAKIYLALAAVDPSYHKQAASELERARELAPTDPKLAYNLGLIYTRMDETKKSESQLKDAITLKPNYPEPYYALTLLYEQTKQIDQIAPLLTSAKSNLATYSALLREKIEKYTN